MENSSSTVISEPRRRQNIACLTCKRRKVRCDAAYTDPPCTPCRRGGLQCSPSDKVIAGRPAASRQRAARHSISRQHSDINERVLPEEVAPTRTPSAERSPAQSTKPEISTSLSNFVEQGVTTSNWKLFSGQDPTRVVYIGTPIGNLAALVGNEQPANLTNHFPFPANKSPLPWKPKPGVLPFTVSDDLLRDVGSVPTREVRDALVEAYFQHIHPIFPVLSEPLFRRQYDDPRNPPPLILLQAVLLAGAHVTDHPLVAASRSTVKNTLYRRARELFHIRYENDRLFLVQAALLMTWHQENADEVSCNTWSWTGMASRIAFGLGAHRELSSRVSIPMPTWDRRRYRFVWWTLFHTETFAALHFGRPCSIRLEDFDVPDLCANDYLDPDDNPDNSVRRDCFELNIALSYIAQDAMRLFAPRAHVSLQSSLVASINSRLASLAVTLPTGDDAFSCQARLNYHLVLLHAHRPNRNTQTSTNTNDPINTTTSSSEALKVRSEAASTMLSTLEIMVAKDHIRQCHFPCNTALMAVVVQFMQDITLAISGEAHARSVILASGAHAKLGRAIGPGREIARYWPNAESVLKLCQRQHEKFGAVIQACVNEPMRSPVDGGLLFGGGGAAGAATGAAGFVGALGGTDGDAGDGFWRDLFAAYDADGVNFGVEGEWEDYGWMNTSSSI